MNHDFLTCDERNIRATDSNSLLRMYDMANEVFTRTALQQERQRADKAIQRIGEELDKRQVTR
jgi:hypothetical protein